MCKTAAPQRLLLSILILCCCIVPCLAQTIGQTRVAKWQDDKKAVFLLMFDDSWPSHFEVAMPELINRNMIATFYINPGKGEFKVFKDKWTKELWKSGMVYGNHTMTHKGVADIQDAQKEIGLCTQYIRDTICDGKPVLISWGRPGVAKGKWNITKDELEILLSQYNLIDRPTFNGHGAVYHMQKSEQMLALADKAIATGDMEYLIIHGVERRTPLNTQYQDFWALNQDVYRQVLDGLAQRRDSGDLWITDHISYHKYLSEFATAKVNTLKANSQLIELKLTSQADKTLYDQPLTLITNVPQAWQICKVTQGDHTIEIQVKNNTVQYDVIPDQQVVTLQPLSR